MFSLCSHDSPLTTEPKSLAEFAALKAVLFRRPVPITVLANRCESVQRFGLRSRRGPARAKPRTMTYKRQRIRDPLHSVIGFEANEFEDALWSVIQTRPFQRLRRIKQLGFSDFVYPGATHSRFIHSVGAFHTARQLMRVIGRHLGDSLAKNQSERALAAALLHDLGLCFRARDRSDAVH